MDDNKRLLTELLETYFEKKISPYISTKEIVREDGKRKVKTGKALNPDLEQIVDTFMQTLPGKNTPDYKNQVYDFFDKVQAIEQSESRSNAYIGAFFIGTIATGLGLACLTIPTGIIGAYASFGITVLSIGSAGITRRVGYTKPLRRLTADYAERWNRLDSFTLKKEQTEELENVLEEAQYALATDDYEQKEKAKALIDDALTLYPVKGLLPPK